MLLSTPNDSQLDQLYREIRPELLRYFRARHGNDQAAEDLLQETFATIMRNPARVLEAESPRAYLFGVARHMSAEAFRRTHPLEVLPSDDLPETASETEDPRLDAMREAIAKLNPTLRQVLQLRLRQELSYEQIAETLGIPVGTVRSRLHYAVKELSAAMKTNL